MVGFELPSFGVLLMGFGVLLLLSLSLLGFQVARFVGFGIGLGFICFASLPDP